MISQLDAGAAARNASSTDIPRKKKEKKTPTVIDGDRHTSFMHSLMGEDATEENRQKTVMDVAVPANTQGLQMNYYGMGANMGSHPSNGQYNSDAHYNYAYQNQTISNQNNMGISTAVITADNTAGFEGNNYGYDYTKSFQMMPMQRFMGSTGQGNYKYDSSEHQQLTDDTMRIQKPSKTSRDSTPDNRSTFDTLSMNYYPPAQSGESTNNVDNVGDGDCGSDTHSAVGEGDNDPHKRKTRNQREQKR